MASRNRRLIQRIISRLEESGILWSRKKMRSKIHRRALQTSTRAWAKSLVWRVVGVFVLGGISWLVTRNWEEVTTITLAFHCIQTALYYFHERMWERIEWGKIKHPLSEFDVAKHLDPDDRRIIEAKLRELGYID